MMTKKKDYTGKRFDFTCRRCGKKREFEFEKEQHIKKGVLICLTCGYRIARSLYLLDKQIKEGGK